MQCRDVGIYKIKRREQRSGTVVVHASTGTWEINGAAGNEGIFEIFESERRKEYQPHDEQTRLKMVFPGGSGGRAGREIQDQTDKKKKKIGAIWFNVMFNVMRDGESVGMERKRMIRERTMERERKKRRTCRMGDGEVFEVEEKTGQSDGDVVVVGRRRRKRGEQRDQKPVTTVNNSSLCTGKSP